MTGYVAGAVRSPLAAHGATMNNLLPGAFVTDRLAATYQAAADRSGQSGELLMEQRRQTIPALRFGNVTEFGAICAFLCSQQAGYFNGKTSWLTVALTPESFRVCATTQCP